MLHIVKSVHALEEAIVLISATDKVLLVEQAVFVANPQHKAFAMVKGLNVAVLDADVVARGMDNRISHSVVRVDYEGYVELTVEQPKSMTWE